MFPARKIAIATWIAAAAVATEQQYYQPFLQKEIFHAPGGLMIALDSLAKTVTWAGGLAALGAILHLLSEIRDATQRNATGENP